ncbi:NAD(P)-binding protein [Amniculicola lignicola CBS 123094]|uniref:3-dehydrosphinganine reductase n=1 Tax=Amniculicola lignicola CBS 123094 TaxID=1392246 RepID=A0A6A5WP26_9PLEO|nr:NAD(P)-binding protein [Amniculicola lignicola CBS 123094]
MAQLLLWASIALLLLVAYLSLQIMGFLTRGDKFKVEGRTVLLTGASYGMGREIAKLLSQRGANIILVARGVEKLQSALEYAKSHAKNLGTQRFHFISADVTSETENDRLLAEATTWNDGQTPEIVWANAGASKPQLFIETSIATLRAQFELNYWAAAYLSHKTLKAWLYPTIPYAKDAKTEASRHFIMTSSALGLIDVAGYTPYAPAKSAMRSLSDTLRQEILIYNGARRSKKITAQAPAPFDVEIQLILPGSVRSPGFENENKTKHPVSFLIEESDPDQSPIEAATAALKGLDHGQYMTPTNWLVQILRFSSLAGVPRDNIIKDTLGSWLASVIWLFAGPDCENKVWNWGKKEGMQPFKPEAK